VNGVDYFILKMQIMSVTSFKMAAAIVVTAGFFAFSPFKGGSIRGTVLPADGAVRAWAESSTDTLRAPIINGSYEITDAKPGTYKIIIEAKPPYRNIAKDGIMVNDGQASDAGEIKLEK
jgi:hypothetical protein